MKIAVLAYDGFTDIDLFLPWDFLWRVKVPYGAGYTGVWNPIICADSREITSYSGVRVGVSGTIADVCDADGVFIVSGDGSRAKLADPEYMAALRLDPTRQRIAAIDSGVLILAALGLLKGKTATTYATVFPELEAMGITTERKALVTHGSIATAGGCLAGLDLAGWLGRGSHWKRGRTGSFSVIQPRGIIHWPLSIKLSPVRSATICPVDPA